MAQQIGNPWAMEMEPKTEEIHQRSCRINPKIVATYEQLNSIEPHRPICFHDYAPALPIYDPLHRACTAGCARF